MPMEQGFLLHNRYRIEQTIAVGGMGAIYRAQDETLRIPVAVKENFFTTDEFSRQFRREATILAGLRHPNLPRVTDHFVIPGQGQYLVMDFIEGTDLREIINQHGAQDEKEVIRIGVTVCNALTFLHGRTPPIVHRDIKPGNLKIAPNGQVFLVDFGLAKISHGEATTTGAQALTPGYAPPEQYGQGTDPRSDLYALGATLYAALTGKIPEDGLSRVMGTAELTPIRQHRPDVTERTAQAIERAMMVKPADRFADASAFRAALEPPVVTHPPASTTIRKPPAVTPPQPEVPTQEQKPAAPVMTPAAPPPAPPRRSGLGMWLGIGAAAVLLGGAALLFLLRMPPFAAAVSQPTATIAPSTAVAARTVALPTDIPGPVATETLTPTDLPTGTPAPTQTLPPTPTHTLAATATLAGTPQGGGLGQIAYSSDQGGTVQIWSVNSDGSDRRQITSLGDGACQPDWSPDGKRIVFISPCAGEENEYPGSSLFIINADGTGLVPLVTLPGGDFDPAWSPDGAQIAFTTLRDRIPHIYLYTLADNTVKRVSSPVNRDSHPAWSPDGTRLAYKTTRLGLPQIWTMAPDGSGAGEFSKLDGANDTSPAWSPDGGVVIFSRGSRPILFARQYGDPQAAQYPISERVQPVEDARFSPDGYWLAFTGQQDGSGEIFIMLRNGSSLVNLSNHPGADFHPAWRPPTAP